ncbi:hypothetical protein EJB05_48827 [Eragrostis curvula]|uniref:Uncharacterized protein n=1 Tax=Eragrostis curvula TaxID=38414 RepID=A0A5J9T2P9_9POAL|nr:hypothetical protein EJB05_48827 [Eragrostis curvula]
MADHDVERLAQGDLSSPGRKEEVNPTSNQQVLGQSDMLPPPSTSFGNLPCIFGVCQFLLYGNHPKIKNVPQERVFLWHGHTIDEFNMVC